MKQQSNKQETNKQKQTKENTNRKGIKTNDYHPKFTSIVIVIPVLKLQSQLKFVKAILLYTNLPVSFGKVQLYQSSTVDTVRMYMRVFDDFSASRSRALELIN